MFHNLKINAFVSEPDLEGAGSPTMFMRLAIYTIYACHLGMFNSEESLFVDAKLSVVQTAVFHLNIV